MKNKKDNNPAAGKAGIALLFAVGHHCPGLPEPGRSANEATMIPSTARFTSQFCRAAALSLRSARNLIAAFLVAGTTHVLASSVDLRVVGRWLTPSFAEDLAVDGQYAYVADYLEGLQVVSISDPTSPQKVGALSTGGGAWGIALSGTYAYVADDKSGLQVVDVSNPVAPRKVGEWTNAPCTMVRIFGDTAFVETSLVGSGRVRVLDLSDPRNPAQIASVDYVPQTIESGGRAYASDLYLGLVVLDFHDLTNPQTLGSYDTGPGKPSTTSVAVSGSYAFVTDNDFFGLKGRGLVILDVNDPSNPQQVWEQPTSASADLVAVAGQRAFVASHGGWASQVGYLQTFDVGNPREAALLGGFMVGTVGPATAMVVEGSYVYLAAAGLTIVQVVEGPRWSVPLLDSSGTLRLRISGSVGETVRLQCSDGTWSWIDWKTVTFTNTHLDVTDERGWVAGPRYYRAVSP